MEIIVVNKNEKLMLVALQVVALCFEGFNVSQKLTVVGFVPSLYRNYFPKKESYWMLLAQIGFSDYPIWPSFGS